MKSSGMAVALLLAIFMVPVHALDVKSMPYTPRQVGQADRVQLGLAVQGWTKNQELTVAAAYELTCPGGTPLRAGRAASQQQTWAGFSFTLTVPTTVPAEYPIPGWTEWGTPATKRCSFVFTGRAKEAIVVLGGFGIGMTLGHGEAVDEDTILFDVVKPLPKGTDSGTCNP